MQIYFLKRSLIRKTKSKIPKEPQPEKAIESSFLKVGCGPMFFLNHSDQCSQWTNESEQEGSPE